MKQLPPLNALRTFEVVSQRLSVSKAAEDLFVSQSAVSQQIKNLEAHFGFQLFVRKPTGLTLTMKAKKLLPAVSQAFNLINDAIDTVNHVKRPINIKASTSLSMCWVMPKLAEFGKQNTDIQVSINAVPIELDNDNSTLPDIEIKYSLSKIFSDSTFAYLDEWLVPVSSPLFLKGKKIKLMDIYSYKLLLNSPGGQDWKLWAKHQSLNKGNFSNTIQQALVLPTDSAAIEMAIAGYGIALANLHYVKDKLLAGILMTPLEVSPFQLGIHNFTVNSPLVPGRIKRVVTWLEEETNSKDIRKQLGLLGVCRT